VSLKKTIFRNVTALFISRGAARILTFIIVVLIARYLGKSNFGIYAAAQSFVGLFVVLLSLGMEQGFVYKGTKDRSAVQWFLGSGILLKLFLGILVVIIVIVAAKLLGYPLTTECYINICFHLDFSFFSGLFLKYFPDSPADGVQGDSGHG
jgi:O-antigen/teichoic acid export membrane protein